MNSQMRRSSFEFVCLCCRSGSSGVHKSQAERSLRPDLRLLHSWVVQTQGHAVGCIGTWSVQFQHGVPPHNPCVATATSTQTVECFCMEAA